MHRIASPIFYVSFRFSAYAVKLLPMLWFGQAFGSKASIAGGFQLSSNLTLVIVATSIALKYGILPNYMNDAMLLMALIICIFSPILFSILFGKSVAVETFILEIIILISRKNKFKDTFRGDLKMRVLSFTIIHAILSLFPFKAIANIDEEHAIYPKAQSPVQISHMPNEDTRKMGQNRRVMPLENIIMRSNTYYGEIETYPPNSRPFKIKFTNYESSSKRFTGSIRYLIDQKEVEINGSILGSELIFTEQGTNGVFTLSVQGTNKVKGLWRGKSLLGDEITKDVWFEFRA
jgi:hypothetical protein